MTFDYDIEALVEKINSPEVSPLEALPDLREFTHSFNSLVERRCGVHIFVDSLLELLPPDNTQDKFVYQVKVGRMAYGEKGKEATLINCHLFPGEYKICLTLVGGSSPIWCHSKEALQRGLIRLLGSPEAIWKMQSIRHDF